MSNASRCVDLFCGGGGFSEGAVQAGVELVMAGDQWPYAMNIHKKNHPQSAHFVGNLHEADFSTWPEHDMAVAGPSCKGFTRARGRERAHHEYLRSSMWLIPRCAEVHHELVWIVENVPEVLDWEHWPKWKADMEALGYSVQPHVYNADDFGVPQSRVRAYILCTKTPGPVQLDMRPWMQPGKVAVRSFIDWDYPVWSDIEKPGRSEKILRQIKQARRDLGTDTFLFPYYGSGSGLTGRSLDRPSGTIVAQDVWAVARGSKMRMLQPHEAQRIMSFPKNYSTDGSRRNKMRMFGNAVCPAVAKALVEAVAQQTGLISLRGR